jgi:hypothetical protein
MFNANQREHIRLLVASMMACLVFFLFYIGMSLTVIPPQHRPNQTLPISAFDDPPLANNAPTWVTQLHALLFTFSAVIAAVGVYALGQVVLYPIRPYQAGVIILLCAGAISLALMMGLYLQLIRLQATSRGEQQEYIRLIFAYLVQQNMILNVAVLLIMAWAWPQRFLPSIFYLLTALMAAISLLLCFIALWPQQAIFIMLSPTLIQLVMGAIWGGYMLLLLHASPPSASDETSPTYLGKGPT